MKEPGLASFEEVWDMTGRTISILKKQVRTEAFFLPLYIKEPSKHWTHSSYFSIS